MKVLNTLKYAQSEILYGQLQSESQSFGFLELKPSSSIGICGNKSSLTQKDLQKCLKVLEREKDENVTSHYNTPY